MTETVSSVNGIAIRLTDERWAHITEEHSELAGMRFEVLENSRVANTRLQSRERRICLRSEK